MGFNWRAGEAGNAPDFSGMLGKAANPGAILDDWANSGQRTWMPEAPYAAPKTEADARAQQAALTGQMTQWGTTGTGPSAAQALLDRSRQANIAQAQSGARSAVGVNPYLANRMAQGQAAQANQSAAEQAAILRAREQQAMLQQAAQGQQNMRQGDLGLYEAQLRAQAAQQGTMAQQEATNAGVSTSGILGNMSIRGSGLPGGQRGGGFGGMTGTGFLGKLSDRRAKTNIKPMTNRDLDHLLSLVGG
jgi:hypothetical protein